ncbi:hypothetical protein EDD36DRAFT_133244 [Exophiala viscosa]|uniref:Uncharacterized protein n=1 Tax=Exophiala viscosa TaxID=2486360 RepID=A0AAN6E205_9EURO|nr:hypothetical protein EDD36DRAFT_133244 [Exophiala viscosa]
MSVNSTTTVVATEMTTSTLVLANLSSTTTESVDTIMPSLTPASVPDTVVLTFPPLPTITASQDSNSTVTNTFGQTATVTETSIALVTLTTTTDGPGPAPFVPVPATTAMSESSLDQENMTTTTTTMISTRNISLVIITSGTTTVFPTISSGLTTGTGTGSVNSTSSNITTFNASTQTPTFGVLSTSSLSLTPVQTGSAASFRVPYFARAVVLIGRMLVKADDLPIAVSAPDSGLINVTVAGPTPAGAPVPMSIPIISTSTFYDNCTTTSTTDISSISVSVPLPFPAPETFESISSSTTVTDTLTAQTTIETTVVIDNTTATFNVPVIPPQFTTPSPGSLAPPPFFNMTGQLATTTAPDVTTAPSTDSNSSTTTPFNLLTFLTGTGADNDTATDTPPSETGLWLNTSSGLDAHNSYLTSSASTYPPTPTPTAHGGAGVAMPLPPKGLVIGTVTCLLFMGAGAWIVL